MTALEQPAEIPDSNAIGSFHGSPRLSLGTPNTPDPAHYEPRKPAPPDNESNDS
ncbi:hypothetical protein [Pseudomonas aeruginosa]|uniref:hypothetical protein n=1 Tax=Pseudomonas aeruginosa TaxID=287 RepID=UPI00273A549C|nr:hypothetical protein [Pseudomonas aeruginosa]